LNKLQDLRAKQVSNILLVCEGSWIKAYLNGSALNYQAAVYMTNLVRAFWIPFFNANQIRMANFWANKATNFDYHVLSRTIMTLRPSQTTPQLLMGMVI